jgi:hypothetical protein
MPSITTECRPSASPTQAASLAKSRHPKLARDPRREGLTGATRDCRSPLATDKRAACSTPLLGEPILRRDSQTGPHGTSLRRLCTRPGRAAAGDCLRGIAQAALDGVSDGPAPPKQSCARRRPAAIGVIQMSPTRCRAVTWLPSQSDRPGCGNRTHKLAFVAAGSASRTTPSR